MSIQIEISQGAEKNRSAVNCLSAMTKITIIYHYMTNTRGPSSG